MEAIRLKTEDDDDESTRTGGSELSVRSSRAHPCIDERRNFEVFKMSLPLLNLGLSNELYRDPLLAY